MFIDKVNEKFSEFYSENDIQKAKRISKDILTILDDKGLKPFEPADGGKSIYIHAFDDYFSTFELNPNPNKDGLETMRIIILNHLKYEN